MRRRLSLQVLASLRWGVNAADDASERLVLDPLALKLAQNAACPQQHRH
jgi:hypothetical protein